MKTLFKLSTLVLCVLSISTLKAQNWQVVEPNTVYNYQADSADFITNTIKVDSVGQEEGNTVFYLNRIMTPCDTCSSEHYALSNQAQFLMRKVLKPSDSLFIFKDPNTLVIKPFKHINNTWVSDEDNNISAVITFEGQMQIEALNQMDSVKKIVYSDGKEILLSKNYGIITVLENNTPLYNLVGIENANGRIGEYNPTFHDFFDWKVGDVFQSKSEFNNIGGMGYGKTKFTITSKEVRGDSIIYSVEGWKWRYSVSEDGYIAEDTAMQFTSTSVFVDSIEHFANKTNAQMVDLRTCRDIYTFKDNDIESFSPYYFTRVHLGKNNGRVFKIVDAEFDNVFGFYTPSSDNENIFVPTSEGELGLLSFYRYTEGLGLSSYNLMFFEGSESYAITGKIHQGDTIGHIDSDSYFEELASISENKIAESISIYPNPVKTNELLHIKTQYAITSYSIYNLSGVLLDKGISQNKQIPIKNLKSGVYILELQVNNRTIRKKLLIE